MQKWEYCVIHGLSGTIMYHPRCDRMTNKGVEYVTDFKSRPKGASEWDAVAQFIAQLGDEGWEMVGAGTTSDIVHSIYFKRPKP